MMKENIPPPAKNRKMSSINDMLDNITEEVLNSEPFDQKTEVFVDPSLNYGLESYRVVSGEETFNHNISLQNDGMQFVNLPSTSREDDDERMAPPISKEMEIFNKCFNDAARELQRKGPPKKPPVEKEPTPLVLRLRQLEAAFSKSEEKAAMKRKFIEKAMETGWKTKVDIYTAKLLNANLAAGRNVPLQAYMDHITQYCTRTMPPSVREIISTDVKAFSKQFEKSFDEIYAEAQEDAANITPEELQKLREWVAKNAPSKTTTVYYDNLPPISFEASSQTETQTGSMETQTIDGLESLNGNEIESIVRQANENVEMPVEAAPSSAPPESKPETNEERMKRSQEDMGKALNPNRGLTLDAKYPDHRNTIKKLEELMEPNIEIFQESLAADLDKSVRDPEILTFIWNEETYKMVTTFSWTIPTCDADLPLEKQRKRVLKKEKLYLCSPKTAPDNPRILEFPGVPPILGVNVSGEVEQKPDASESRIRSKKPKKSASKIYPAQNMYFISYSDSSDDDEVASNIVQIPQKTKKPTSDSSSDGDSENEISANARREIRKRCISSSSDSEDSFSHYNPNQYFS